MAAPSRVVARLAGERTDMIPMSIRARRRYIRFIEAGMNLDYRRTMGASVRY